MTLVWWRPLQQKGVTYFLLRSEAPSQEALSDVLEQAGDSGDLLTRFWVSHRIPHRQFVLSYLSRVSVAKPALSRAMEPVVLEATADADIETRESAFGVLIRLKHPQLRRLALEQLLDADPAARLIGLQSLRSIASSNDVPIAIGLLNDPEPRVVVAAALVLRQMTGLDFGIKSVHAMPRFTCIDTNPPPAPDMEAINRGVQRWRNWWNVHHADYPEPPPASPVQTRTTRLPTPDFNLEDSTGKRIQLSHFRGRPVLLAFWSLGAPASLDDVPALRTLQQRNADRLAVLGVCVPTAPSCADEHEHAHHHQSSASRPELGQMRAQVQQAADRLKINYPMLLDAKGQIGLRFHIQELPAYVLIDSEGFIRRRFVGFRTEAALGRMLEEVADSSATPLAHRPRGAAASCIVLTCLSSPEGATAIIALFDSFVSSFENKGGIRTAVTYHISKRSRYEPM